MGTLKSTIALKKCPRTPPATEYQKRKPKKDFKLVLSTVGVLRKYYFRLLWKSSLIMFSIAH
jgi:hypothetical protein